MSAGDDQRRFFRVSREFMARAHEHPHLDDPDSQRDLGMMHLLTREFDLAAAALEAQPAARRPHVDVPAGAGVDRTAADRRRQSVVEARAAFGPVLPGRNRATQAARAGALIDPDASALEWRQPLLRLVSMRMMPRRSASATIAVRPCTFSFEYMLLTCASTVSPLMRSCVAISLVRFPAASSSRT